MQKRYFCIVLVVSVYFESGSSETGNSTGNDTEAEEENTDDIVTDHTFVALIDIVYTDGSKRSCTGAIIDDNVVVTAAHCFVVDYSPDVKPELTASFVVIGTKKMFETGYEQYLPIERVQTHPKFHGWTADICLVHTYAAMTGDKPGSVIQLAGAKLSEHVDVNFTVLSWGWYGDIDNSVSTKAVAKPKKVTVPQDSCDSSEGKDQGSKESSERFTVSMPKHRDYKGFRKARPPPPTHIPSSRSRESGVDRQLRGRYRLMAGESEHKRTMSRYLASDDEEMSQRRYPRAKEKITLSTTKAKEKEPSPIAKEALDGYLQSIWNKFTRIETEATTTEGSDTSIKSYYKNWRRQMPTQQNSLVADIFGLVNNHICKKLIEKETNTEISDVNQNDLICFASDDRCVTDRDSGAPAVRQGYLVAVTVGNVECDGDQVGVGVKMACYCSWIAQNVPSGRNMTCCKNCCHHHRNKGETKPTTTTTANPKKNKYLLR